MRIRLSLTLSIDRDREPDEPQRESAVDALVSDGPQQHDAPRIGFRSMEVE